MRFLYGAIGFSLWVWVLGYFVTNGAMIDDNTVILSTAIIVCGAMAGGS